MYYLISKKILSDPDERYNFDDLILFYELPNKMSMEIYGPIKKNIDIIIYSDILPISDARQIFERMINHYDYYLVEDLNLGWGPLYVEQKYDAFIHNLKGFWKNKKIAYLWSTRNV